MRGFGLEFRMDAQAEIPGVNAGARSEKLPPACSARSVPDRDAGDVGALQRPADRLGLIAVEPGEARAKQLFVAPCDHGLGKRVGIAQHSAGALARGLETLPCL